MRNFVLFSHITAYIEFLSAYISEKLYADSLGNFLFSAHNVL